MSMTFDFNDGNPEPERVRKLPLVGDERVIYVMQRGSRDEPSGGLWKERMEFCMQNSRCAVCGDVLGVHRLLLFRGPELIVARLSDFPAMHSTCGFWLMRSSLLRSPVPMALEMHGKYRKLDHRNGGVPNYLQPTQRPESSCWWRDGKLMEAGECVQALKDYEAQARPTCETENQHNGLTAVLIKALETLLPTV